MLNQRRYVSRTTCTQLLWLLLVVYVISVAVAAIGIATHDTPLLISGLAAALAIPIAIVHWIVEPSWPTAAGVVVVPWVVIQVSAAALCPGVVLLDTPPPKKILAV